MKILSYRFRPTGSTLEVHLLQPGDHFAGFGGSSRGLTVRKTPSIITRFTDGGDTTDREWNIDSAELWAWINRVQVLDNAERVPVEFQPLTKEA